MDQLTNTRQAQTPMAQPPMAQAPTIVKIGGTFLDEPEKHRATLEGIAALHAHLQAHLQAHEQARGGGVIFVHGGGILVDRHLTRLGITTERIEGIRVTPPDVVEEIVGVLAGRVNTRLVGLLSSVGVRAVGLSLGDGGLCVARKATRYAFDPGAVGEIVDGDPAVVTTLLAAGFMPVVSSIGLDRQGAFLNINADDAAAAIARVTRARELVLLTDVPGVLDKQGAVIPSLDAAAIAALIADGTISGGMIAKVRGALDAAQQANVPVTIASWKDPASVITTASRAASRTTITPHIAPGALAASRAASPSPQQSPSSSRSVATNTH